MSFPSDSQTSDDQCSVNESSRSQSPWNALRNGYRKSAFLPYKASVTVLTNLQRGNTEAHTPVIEAEELNFHQKAAQGDLTIKDIKQESDINIVDEEGLTPLMWASAYGQYPIVEALLQSSAKVDLENLQGQTALLLAAYGGYHEVVRLLIANGADVNHKDEIGNTALIYAATGNNPHTTNELLLRNADFSILNIFGESAYIVAVKKENYVASHRKPFSNSSYWNELIRGEFDLTFTKGNPMRVMQANNNCLKKKAHHKMWFFDEINKKHC